MPVLVKVRALFVSVRFTRRKTGRNMDGKNNGSQEATQGAQDQAQQQGQEQQETRQSQSQVGGNETDYEKQITERDEKIASLETQVAEAAKNAKTAEQLHGEIAELKAQGESDHIDFKLQLAGVRNVKAARALLGDRGNDVDSKVGAGRIACRVGDARPAGAPCPLQFEIAPRGLSYSPGDGRGYLSLNPSMGPPTGRPPLATPPGPSMGQGRTAMRGRAGANPPAARTRGLSWRPALPRENLRAHGPAASQAEASTGSLPRRGKEPGGATFPGRLVERFAQFLGVGHEKSGFAFAKPLVIWSRGQDLNLRPPGYEPGELPDCSTPQCLGAPCAQGSNIAASPT